MTARRGTLLVYVRADAATGAPLVPGTWDVVIEANRWATIYPLGRAARPDIFFHARNLYQNNGFSPPRACYVCVGYPAVLQRLADRIAADGLPWTKTWADLPTLRADATTPATTIVNNWLDDRPLDSNGNPVGIRCAMRAFVAGFDGDDAEA